MTRFMTGLGTVAVALAALAACTTCASPPEERIPGWPERLRELSALPSANLRVDGSPLIEHYWQDGRQTPVTVVPNLLAVVGPRSIVQPKEEFIPGVVGDATDGHPALERLARGGVLLLATAPEGSPEINALIEAPPKGALVGRVILFPRPETEPNEWAAAVLTPEVVWSVRPELVKGLSDDDARAAVGRMAAPHGLEVTGEEILGGDTFLLRARGPDAAEWLRAAQRLHDDPASSGVAHPNLILGIETHQAPVDPFLREQWHLRNTGQYGGKQGADIHIERAWAVTEGVPSVILAIIDPYLADLTHPDLAANVAPGSRDFTPASASSGSSPLAGAHATWVAGVAVAARNQVGVRGVAPGCRFVSLAISLAPTEFTIAKAIYAAPKLGCRVINLSWGYTPGTEGASDLVWSALNYATGQGNCVVVASVPNQVMDAAASLTRSFVQHKRVIAVGRSTDIDVWGRCGYGACVSVVAPSGYAPGTWTPGSECVETAPSSSWGFRNVATTDPQGGLSGNSAPGIFCVCQPMSAASPLPDLDDLSYTRCFRGTSAAAPQVAGAAALLISVRPALIPAQVRRAIESAARRIPAPVAVPTGPDSVMNFPYVLQAATGLLRSDAVGHGCLNVMGAMNVVLNLAGGSE